MAFMYFLYQTNQGNTIISASTTSITPGTNQAVLYANYSIPAVQPLYLYAVNGGGTAVITNTDSQITSYLKSIGQVTTIATDYVFTGYTATTKTQITYISGQTAQKLNSSLFATYTGTTAPATYARKSVFNTYTGTTAPNQFQSHSSIVTLTGTTLPATYVFKAPFSTYTGTTAPATFALKTLFNTYTGTTAPASFVYKAPFSTYTGTTAPATYVFKTPFNTYTGTTAPATFVFKAPFSTYTGTTAPATYAQKTNFNTYTGTTAPATYLKISNFNPYSASTLTNINSRLLTSAFNTYSGNTLALIQSSQAGLDPKASVIVATVAALSGATAYNATGGTAGTGAFSSAPTKIDGVSVTTAGIRILVKNQAQPKQNGIYTVISSGVWNRSSDMNGVPSTNVSAGNYTFVETGNTNVGTGWVTTGNGYLVLNTDPIKWTQFNAATAYIAGTGISIVGQTISFNGASVAGNSLTWSGTQLNVSTTGGTLQTALNTKANTSQLIQYTGTTAPATYVFKAPFSTYTGTTAPATYVFKALFSTYTGTTAPATYALKANFNTYTGTTAPATYALKSLFNTYTGTTAPNSFQSHSSIVTLTGTTLPATYVFKAPFSTYTGTTAPATYVFKTPFSTYTGTTAPATYALKANFNTYTGTTAPATYALKSLFNTYTGTTAPATYALKSLFNTYTGTTAPSTYLKITTFNVYSGVTQTLINSKVSSANNGLRLSGSGTNVKLGGTLTGATTIGLGSVSLTFTGTTGTLKYGSDLSANYTARSLMDYGTFTGNTLYTKAELLIYSSASTNINVTTAVAIPFNVAPIRNNATYYTQTGGTTIKILVGGIYDVWFNINLSNGSATSKSLAANLYQNGTIVNNTLAQAMFSTTNSGTALVLPPTQITFAANDTIQIQGYRLISASGNATIVPNSTFLSIVKKY